MGINYLRISVTDRCNMRCIYCNPMEDCEYIDRKEILRFEEIRRIVGLFAQCGVNRVRLTGGEPLVRKDIAALVRKLAGIAGIEEIALTTNGVLLDEMAGDLKAAGLSRVNISIDSAERENYQRITGFDLLEKAMNGIHEAMEVGLAPVKINAVILRQVNYSQIPALAQMSIHLPLIVRFIEYYPTGKYEMAAGDYVPNGEVRGIIEDKFGLLSSALVPDSNGPAFYFKIRNSAGAIGFISGRSSVFCRSCNRLRLTSEGKIRPCLYAARHYDVKKLIRAGAGDRELRALFEKIIREKSGFTRLNSFTEEFSMFSIGG